MPSAVESSRASKAILIAGLLFVITWAVSYETGKSLPYIQTAQNFQFRMYVLLQSLVLFLTWFGFLHRWRESGKSSYQMAMGKLANRAARIKHTTVGLFGLIVIAAVFCWSSVFYAAWAANLLPGGAFTETYQITDVRSVSSHYVLDLETKDHRQASLPVRVNELQRGNWRSGDVICARGRSTAFGVIVESINHKECPNNAT